jgi:pyruvate/2-oxoglutarate/acetoin dehydrogenase E1 component
MAQMTVLEALNAAMAHELQRDPDVVLLGEDVGTEGGIFRTTEGLQLRFGSHRVIDTPLDEKGIAAHAVGMALYGLKPIVEIQFSGFIHDAFEQIMFCASKYRWATSGLALSGL